MISHWPATPHVHTGHPIPRHICSQQQLLYTMATNSSCSLPWGPSATTMIIAAATAATVKAAAAVDKLKSRQIW